MNPNLEKKLAIGLGMTLLLILLITVYWVTEPSRQRSAEANFKHQAIERGAEHIALTCTLCHGIQGRGGIGPSLRETRLEEKELVKVISRGRGAMPAWSREEGGLFNSHQIQDIVTFVLNWDEELWEVAWQHAAPVAATPIAPGPEIGPVAQLFEERGCLACHRINGKGGAAGPSLMGTYGKEAELVTGETVVRDDQYLRNSILNPFPGTRQVKGYPLAMPTYKDRLTDEEVNQLVEFIKSLGAPSVGVPEIPTPYKGQKNPFPWDSLTAQNAGKAIYQQNCLACHGDKGDGKGGIGATLTPPPSDFTAAARHQKLEAQPDYMLWRLAQGSPGTAMPPFDGRLSQEQMWQVLTYLWSLGK